MKSKLLVLFIHVALTVLALGCRGDGVRWTDTDPCDGDPLPLPSFTCGYTYTGWYCSTETPRWVCRNAICGTSGACPSTCPGSGCAELLLVNGWAVIEGTLPRSAIPKVIVAGVESPTKDVTTTQPIAAISSPPGTDPATHPTTRPTVVRLLIGVASDGRGVAYSPGGRVWAKGCNLGPVTKRSPSDSAIKYIPSDFGRVRHCVPSDRPPDISGQITSAKAALIKDWLDKVGRETTCTPADD